MDQWYETTSMVAEDYNGHFSLHYDEIENSGPATRPLEFPTPIVYDCELINLTALDHRTGRTYDLQNCLIMKQNGRRNLPNHAYMVKKTLQKSIYGTLRLCVVLRRRVVRSLHGRGPTVDKWQSTEELVVIKCSSWNKIRHLRGKHLEDPIREIAALQHIGNYHPHVAGCIEVLQDESYLYTIMPYCPGGDLYSKIMFPDECDYDTDGIGSCTTKTMDENTARTLFKQLLLGIYHLQQKGVCHRDISLENIMIDEKGNLVIIDLGLSIRIPYSDPCNPGVLTDVSEGTVRRLIKAQGQGGKLTYIAPEIVERVDAFDGHAVDLWSTGIILFTMLVGSTPFTWAHKSDSRFRMVANGRLKELIPMINDQISLSSEVCDLLQNMLWRNPRERYTLSDIMHHPWVVNEGPAFQSDQVKPTEKGANNTWSTYLSPALHVFRMPKSSASRLGQLGKT